MLETEKQAIKARVESLSWYKKMGRLSSNKLKEMEPKKKKTKDERKKEKKKERMLMTILHRISYHTKRRHT